MTDEKTARWSKESIHFVTGKLAEPAVREQVAKLADELGFQYSIQVLPITVAALITPKWLLRHLAIPDRSTRLLVPGYLSDGMEEIQAAIACPADVGPKDIRDLSHYFGKAATRGDDFGAYSIEILAEINHAPRLTPEALLDQAQSYIRQGAEMIDIGCTPGYRWMQVGDALRRLRDAGIRCSIDTFDAWEAAEATRGGAELVLSVNESNREASVDWGAEVVVVPDQLEPSEFLHSLEKTVHHLERNRVRFRIDSILEPIGCGFAASLSRYAATREHFPEAAMMMGIGNLTELTDCDSAGINFLLLAICEEWAIGSVLTTQVIPWAQSAVRECDLARRMVSYAHRHQTPPKRLDAGLVMLRDPKVNSHTEAFIAQLAQSIRDNNFRILVDGSRIHLISAGIHLSGTDPFDIVARLWELPQSDELDPSHAFYLGFELSKALTALTLGKQYEQDVALQWGMLTRPEPHRRISRRKKKSG